MAKLIVTSFNAELELYSITHYILVEFGIKATEKFLQNYSKKVNLIAGFPQRYPFYDEEKEIRKAVLNKYCIIFYKEFEENISIISVFDTRQDPDKIPEI
jgi:plasmid stabilization system protein ParE